MLGAAHNYTDEVQPIDRGFGHHVKIYMGQYMDKQVARESDENLERWEST